MNCSARCGFGSGWSAQRSSELDGAVGVEHVLDHRHCVPAFLFGLLVEVRQARERLVFVVGPDRDVLMRGGELATDLLVEGGSKAL